MERAALAAFAELFAYPRGDVAAAAGRCLALTREPALRRFASWAERATAGEIEETYCTTFDLQPRSAPYVGHHLCADDAQRNLFLAGLAEVYAREGFRPREELPDHLAEVLAFCAAARDEEARAVLLREGLAPALRKMAPALEGNPYRALIDALSAQLDAPQPEEARP